MAYRDFWSPNNIEERLRLAGDPTTEPSILMKLTEKLYDKKTFKRLAANPSVPAEGVQVMANYRFVSDEIEAVLSHPNLSDQLVQELCERQMHARSWWVRYKIARHPRTPRHVLDQLLEDKDDAVRSGIAENPKTTAAELEQLALSNDSAFSTSLAQNPLTPSSVLGMLAKDKSSEVVRWVAFHSSLSEIQMEELAAHPDILVRSHLAMNPSLPAYIIRHFLKDDDFRVRSGLAQCTNLAGEDCERLAADENRHVRTLLATNPVVPGKALQIMSVNADDSLAIRIARHPNVPPELLREYANEFTKHELRRTVALNPNTPADSQEALKLRGYTVTPPHPPLPAPQPPNILELYPPTLR